MMVKKTIIVNSYDNKYSVKTKFKKLNPKKVVTNIKMLPIFKDGVGRKAIISYRKWKK